MRGGIDISAERSEVCLTDRYGNQIRAKGCENRFTVELCRYIDAIACRYGRTVEEYISGDSLGSRKELTASVDNSSLRYLDTSDQIQNLIPYRQKTAFIIGRAAAGYGIMLTQKHDFNPLC